MELTEQRGVELKEQAKIGLNKNVRQYDLSYFSPGKIKSAMELTEQRGVET